MNEVCCVCNYLTGLTNCLTDQDGGSFMHVKVLVLVY